MFSPFSLSKKHIFLDILIGIIFIVLLYLFIDYIFVSLDYKFGFKKLVPYFFHIDGKLMPGLITKGVIVTFKLSVLVVICATVFGVVFAALRYIFPNSLGYPFFLLTEFLRGIPPLVVMFIFYFFIGDRIFPDRFFISDGNSGLLSGIFSFLFVRPEILPQFFSAAMGLAFYEASYISEIIKGGLNGVASGQIDAGRSLGMNKIQIFFRIVLPQAMEKTLPAIAGQYVSIIKNTSIASVVAIPELTFSGMEVLASTMFVFEVWLSIALIYLVINIVLSTFINRLELKVKRKYS